MIVATLIILFKLGIILFSMPACKVRIVSLPETILPSNTYVNDYANYAKSNVDHIIIHPAPEERLISSKKKWHIDNYAQTLEHSLGGECQPNKQPLHGVRTLGADLLVESYGKKHI